jgi:WXXGXW repeat (2 copies)
VKSNLIALMLLAGGTLFAQFSVGIRIGAPPPVRVVHVQPRSPGEGYAWVGGYWYPVSGHYKWHNGYWTRPAYTGAHWVEPHHDGQQYFSGYWDGDHGQIGHDHHSDRDHDRDFKHDHDRQ